LYLRRDQGRDSTPLLEEGEEGRLAAVVRYWMHPEQAGEPVTELFRCPEFEQRVLRFEEAGEERRDAARDEVLYVLEGRGSATIGGEPHGLEPGSAAFVARGTAWRVESADGLAVLSVLVEEPLPADATHALVAAGDRGTATAGREFTLLARPENGCASVTQFVGHIPQGRAPDHFHRYDEVVYVLSGEGAFHVDGESAPLSAGACIHLPAGLVHCLENFGPGEMHVLGVFRPAGSPAEAYYPDGTAAVVPA
jgi:mannose-6-phosphate isomerase-like protein (cupin superfamily)